MPCRTLSDLTCVSPLLFEYMPMFACSQNQFEVPPSLQRCTYLSGLTTVICDFPGTQPEPLRLTRDRAPRCAMLPCTLLPGY